MLGTARGPRGPTGARARLRAPDDREGAVPAPARTALPWPSRRGSARRSPTVRRIIAERDVDVVVGFGGYVVDAGLPRRPSRRHPGRHPRGERQARAWRTGSAPASPRASASRSTARRCRAPRSSGMPLRREIESSIAAALPRRGGRASSGSTPPRPVLLATGRLARRPPHQPHDGRERRARSSRPGWQVLHITGAKSEVDRPRHRRLPHGRVRRPHGPRPRRSPTPPCPARARRP